MNDGKAYLVEVILPNTREDSKRRIGELNYAYIDYNFYTVVPTTVCYSTGILDRDSVLYKYLNSGEEISIIKDCNGNFIAEYGDLQKWRPRGRYNNSY